MFPEPLLVRAAALLVTCRARSIVLATAESCTGGLLAALITEVPGSSATFDRGFVTYSNEAKIELLGIPASLVTQHGAVSAAVAGAMASGVLDRSRASLAVSVTGVAGPGGGTAAKPVGLVYFGCCGRGVAVTTVERRFGEIGRDAIRMASVEQALSLLEQAVAQVGLEQAS